MLRLIPGAYTGSMSVSGGRSGWAWVGEVTALLGILAGTAACGSRTSMLDPDAYATAGHGGSSGVTPSGSAGQTAAGGGLLGTAGASTSPPTPSRGVSACPRSGDGGSNPNCIGIYSCADGPYITFCSSTEAMQFAECACVAPNGAMKSTRVPIQGDLCFDATTLCR